MAKYPKGVTLCMDYTENGRIKTITHEFPTLIEATAYAYEITALYGPTKGVITDNENKNNTLRQWG